MTKGKKIRSYFLEPDQRVIDHKNGMKLLDTKSVLNGNLDPFIEADLLNRVNNDPKS